MQYPEHSLSFEHEADSGRQISKDTAPKRRGPTTRRDRHEIPCHRLFRLCLDPGRCRGRCARLTQPKDRTFHNEGRPLRGRPFSWASEREMFVRHRNWGCRVQLPKGFPSLRHEAGSGRQVSKDRAPENAGPTIGETVMTFRIADFVVYASILAGAAGVALV